ncbi:gamma-tubulin complex component 6 [Microplitis demolitor]|uniref:gamma-tubulin complex component 6 n=1 Tax=Microplitis demolitor TaxID=69319 RepID=UPI0004CDACEE|nr:gamma-tubulin complex component 6 [Microplitis demolitor]XP_008555077.1 gamma-tubulin complex component 6 [Microplitis demolitor]
MTAMNSKEEGYDFFGLVNDLCQSMINKCDDKCLRGRNSNQIVTKLRSIAFEILLKRHPESYDINDNESEEDPVLELFKYSFVLKSTLGQSSKADKLESVLDELLSDDDSESVKSILFFLHYLQNYQSCDDDDLEIFHFGDRNPTSEISQKNNEVPHYQIYPLSAFILPHKLNQLIDINSHEFTQVNIKAPVSFSSQLQIEIAKNETSKLSLYSLDSIKPRGPTEEKYLNYESTAVESLWNREYEDECESVVSFKSSPSIESIELLPDTYEESEDTDCYSWETLGQLKPGRQRAYALESDAAIQHLQNLRNISINGSEKSSSSRPNVISMKEFIENIKLVLLGFDSSCYVWDSKIGFFFNINTVVTGLGKEALESISSEITHWATCFKLLVLLVRPNIDTGRYRQDGLIFQAMCNSVNDVLIHYQASVLQIFNDDSIKLLDLLNRLRYVGCLISELARLCRCENVIQTTLAEGTGILTHIYDQVTKITKPDVALVFYSVLKSCCEIYFELMEKWIFEGIFDEKYGEFMIFVRDKYIRNRGHKFWTKCFGISKELVPGFLNNLTDSILQCGKAVRLLKICDPKNPLCNFFLTARPKVKVCLSVNMLSEQEEICQRYMAKGIEILGPNVTLSSALKELKTIDKDKAEHVIAAQQETLSRIKKSQEEAKLLIIKNKRELFADQKKQVEDAVSRREKAREADLLEDKLLREIQIAEDEKIESQRLADIKITIEYYKDLAEEAEKQRLRAGWRSRRMELFDERVSAIILARQEEITPIDEVTDKSLSVLIKLATEESNVPVSVDSNSLDNQLPSSDNVPVSISDENCNEKNSEQEKETKPEEITRASRPTVLDVKGDAKIESILDEIAENRSFKRTKFSFNTNTISNDIINNPQTTLKNDNVNITFIDKEGNENKMVDTDNDDNKNDQVGDKNSETCKNSNQVESNVVDAPPHYSNNANEINDATPMSCTTDSYVPSAMSNSILYNCTEAGSIAESKNDYETPTSPGECLTRADKREYSIDNIFSRSSSQFFSALGFLSTPPVLKSSLSQADVEMIDNTSLQVYLEKSVFIPLRVQSRLANSAIVKCLLHDHKILSHLHSLRSFFFLLNGEFAKNLTGPLYTKFHQVATPDKLFNSATLTSLLKNALHFSLNNSYKNSELLSLTVMSQPSSMKVLDPEALNCLCLHYKVSWPLNIILDEAVMQQYSKVFRFLIMVGRVLWVLQDDFCILKTQRKATLSFQYHRLQLFRHAMMQFMTALHNYLTCSVLHSSCAEFEKELENAMTLDQIYNIHVRYIKKILSRCMMTRRGEKLRQCLCNIFQIILKFHKTLRSHEWVHTSQGYVHPSFNKLEQYYKAFCTMRSFPAQVVDKYSNNGYELHLTRFLDALNINPLFSL